MRKIAISILLFLGFVGLALPFFPGLLFFGAAKMLGDKRKH